MSTVRCPLCSRDVASAWINEHIDAQCGASQPTTTQAGSSQQQSKRTLGGSSGAGDSGPKGKVTGDRRSSANPKRENAKTEDDGAVASSSSSRRVAEVASLSSLADDSATETRQTKRFKSSQAVESAKPLAERMRPGQLSDVVGQQALLAPNALLRRLIEQDKVGSILLWGPPGSGKTTLARVIANSTNSRFTELSATSASAADLRKVFDEATNMLKLTGRRTMCFIDEIQRFTKAQQDLLLPVVENGTISLLCSTTENPSFRINKALLSRMRVFVLEKLGADDIFALLVRALKAASDESEPASSTLDESLLRFLASAADGDARVALSSLELAISATRDTSAPLSREELKAQLRKAHLQYDRSGDAHCDTISALHKSVRGSNADAALYWLARMLEAGDDPLYVARRLIRMASEDVGTADPTVLPEAVAAYQAALLIGMPECDCVLAQVVVRLAEAPKSVRVYKAYNAAKSLVHKSEAYPVPMHIRNAPTGLMKSLGYGRDYRYEPGYAHPVHQPFFPPELEGTKLLLDVDEIGDKQFDENALREWEWKNLGGAKWEGREELERKLAARESETPG